MLETIIVCLIVVGALSVTVRSLYRSLTGRDEGCKCTGGKSCPRSEKPDARQCVDVEELESRSSETRSPGLS